MGRKLKTITHMKKRRTRLHGAVTQPLFLVRAACVRCHGTKCPLFMAFFSLSFFSLRLLLFSQKELSKGSEILCGLLSHTKNKICGNNKFGGPPLPPWSIFLGVFFSGKKRNVSRIS